MGPWDPMLPCSSWGAQVLTFLVKIIISAMRKMLHLLLRDSHFCERLKGETSINDDRDSIAAGKVEKMKPGSLSISVRLSKGLYHR